MTTLNTIPTNANMKDEMLHITLADGMVRGLLLTATGVVAKAAAIHCTSPLSTAALGRSLMGTAMMGAMLKGEESSVTVTIDGGGPIGKIVCVADAESVRGCVEVPNLYMPLRADGKLSLSRMTFNHEMVRLFFVEQLYRSQTILRGEPYHHS